MPAFNLTITNPTGSATVTIFDTTVRLGAAKMLQLSGIQRISFSSEHDQSFTLKAYSSNDGGTNWDQYFQQAYTASATGICGPVDFLVDTFLDWKLDLLNGGSDQTTFRPTVTYNDNTRVPGN